MSDSLLVRFFQVWPVTTCFERNQLISMGRTLQRLAAGGQPEDPTYLDERESSSGLQRLVLVLHLISHILLHPLVLVQLPLRHHVEEGARGHCDGDSKPGFGLLIGG